MFDSVRDRLSNDERLREVPSQLWDRLRDDPVRAPEHIALAAADFHGPAAKAWSEQMRSRYSYDNTTLGKMAKSKHATLARVGGAATGVGGFLTMIPDLMALAWIQSRLVFFIAAAYGFDPEDPMRPAELLVLQGLYADPATARQALDGVGKTVVEAAVRSRMNKDETLVSKLARMVGKRVGKRVAGRMIPGFAIIFNAVGNERDTRALADRAIRFYSG